MVTNLNHQMAMRLLANIVNKSTHFDRSRFIVSTLKFLKLMPAEMKAHHCSCNFFQSSSTLLDASTKNEWHARAKHLPKLGRTPPFE